MDEQAVIHQRLADSEAAFHPHWRPGDPGELVIPVDVAAAIVAAYLAERAAGQ